MENIFNLKYNDTIVGRNLNIIMGKIISLKKEINIKMTVGNPVMVLFEKSELKETAKTIENKINEHIKGNITENDLISILQPVLNNNISDIDRYVFISNEIDKNTGTKYSIYYDSMEKSVLLKVLDWYDKNENKITTTKNDTEEVKVKERTSQLKASDTLDYGYIDKIGVIKTDMNNNREIFIFLENFIEFCLENDIGDIVVSEDDFPYFVRGESIIKDEILKEKIEMMLGNQKLKKEEVVEFIRNINKLSKTEDVLKQLETKFNEGGKGFVDFAILCNDVKLRVNVAYNGGKKISVVMRVIKSGEPPRMEDLGLVDGQTKAYRNILTQPFGLILVVGPTGSGKSYSLTSMLGEINKTQHKRIITLEDPVEFEHKNKLSRFEQREIGVDVASYAYGLKSGLRQKPHIIVCGEIRDVEVMELAIEAASTGHVVMGTLHANDVVQTVQRIVQMFPLEKQPTVIQNLSEMLLGVFVQKLVPKKGGGKILIKEIMVSNKAIKKAIYDNDMKTLYQNIEAGGELGMMTNDQAILSLFENHKITSDIAYEYAKDKEMVGARINYDKFKD